MWVTSRMLDFRFWNVGNHLAAASETWQVLDLGKGIECQSKDDIPQLLSPLRQIGRRGSWITEGMANVGELNGNRNRNRMALDGDGLGIGNQLDGSRVQLT